MKPITYNDLQIIITLVGHFKKVVFHPTALVTRRMISSVVILAQNTLRDSSLLDIAVNPSKILSSQYYISTTTTTIIIITLSIAHCVREDRV